jgi:hypothetical protein
MNFSRPIAYGAEQQNVFECRPREGGFVPCVGARQYLEFEAHSATRGDHHWRSERFSADAERHGDSGAGENSNPGSDQGFRPASGESG